MSGLYSPINKLMEQVTRPKGTGAEYMAELQKKPGYKPAEAEDRDLQALMALPQMQRAEFMEKLKAQANKFPLKIRELGENQTHHEKYTIPGGENYREILLHTPMPKGQGFEGVPHHFGGMPNILASIRVKDRISPEGKKILHLEEIQSDWHQQGREKGYGTHIKEPTPQELDELGDLETIDMDRLTPEQEDRLNHLDRMARRKPFGVPYGPHAKDWHELALKAMIQHAAENGYDQIAVTPGAGQAKRFGLSKQVGAVSYNPETQHFQAFKPNRETITNEKGATPERIQALIGKEAAAKLLQAPQTMGHHYLEGEDLDIGGEGMKGFYDKMVPTFLNKFGKKHGVQVQRGEINADNPYGHSQVAMLRESGIPEHRWSGIPYEEKERMMKAYSAKQPPMMAPVHTFDITPALREDVLKNGIPRYADGGEVSDDDYRGSHQAPGPHFGAQMHDVSGNGMYPKDFYSSNGLRYYADASDPTDRDAYNKVSRVKGKPNEMVFIHRAIPTSVYNDALKKEAPLKHMIRKGDWVAINKEYAKLHGDSVLKGDYKIASMRVPAKHVWTNADSIHEWGYHPEETKSDGGIPRYADGGEVGEDVPRETTKAYKLFRVHPKHPGKLFPLFVDANTPVEMGKWIAAKEGEMANGKVKSKIGPLAYRPGWHAGDLPIATHIGEKSDPSLTAPDLRPENHAWAEVEMPNDVDWQAEAIKRGTNAQGKLIPVRAHITDQLPVGGHYRYKTNPNMTGNWLIGGSMKVNRVLSDKEVAQINKAAGLADLPRAKPFNTKKFGFAKGGTVAPEEWLAEEHVNHKAKHNRPVKDEVTMPPSMDMMLYELINRKAK